MTAKTILTKFSMKIEHPGFNNKFVYSQPNMCVCHYKGDLSPQLIKCNKY